MASLYDRLNRTMPIQRAQSGPERAACCLVRTETFDTEKSLPKDLSAKTFSYLSGKTISSDLSMEDLLFLDTETTGLSQGAGTIAFLIGLGGVSKSRLWVDQVLMRDYHLEPDLLSYLLDKVKKAKCLVTFNGTSFDLPLLINRLTMYRMEDLISGLPHIDVLHASRRIFKLRLGRCNLTRLEGELMNIKRHNDLPGSEVPKRYFDYLKTGDEKLLEDVLRHNQQDILSLLQLLILLREVHERPLQTTYQSDLLSLGKVFEKHRETDQAAACYRACTDLGLRDMASLRLADMLKRQKRYQEAAREYETLLEKGKFDGRIYISLAIIYEHRFRNPARALEIVRQGMVYCSERMGRSPFCKAHYENLEHRGLRLSRKVIKQHNGIS